MSCATLNTAAVRMDVSAGMLPEGFCPESMQQLFDAMATRLIVTPNSNFTSFAAGSIAPTSNVGPWFKDCEEWFVWDDVTASYVPMMKQGFNEEQYFTASGSFTVPDFIYKIKVSAWGGGGGGHDGSGGTYGGGGGGGGAFVKGILNVLPGQIIPITLGVGGIAGAPGTDGTATTVLTMIAGGGIHSITSTPGQGGGATGGTINVNGGGGAEGYVADPGQGGSSSSGGQGGTASSTANAAITNGIFPGGGGTGGYPGLSATGSGAGGACLVEW